MSFYNLGEVVENSFLTLRMNKWTREVPSVSLETFWLFPLMLLAHTSAVMGDLVSSVIS